MSQAISQSIATQTSMGLVTIGVTDLQNTLAFYTQAIGLQVISLDEEGALLGVGTRGLLRLVARPGYGRWTEWSAGLFHFALLLPTRADLGRWIVNWRDLGMPEFGQGDHNVSEALYLNDPDGHGIEIYRDRPRSEWKWRNGRVVMGSGPVDVRGIVAEAEREGMGWAGMPAGTTMGHVHLQVGDLERARAFYVDAVGFDVVADWPGALFVSAGGYHHHLGLNTWQSQGNGPAANDVVRLESFTIELPDAASLNALRDRLERAGIPVSQVGGVLTARDPWETVVRFIVPA